MLYFNNMLVDFELVRFALQASESDRANIFSFLYQNRDSIDDASVLGVLDFLDKNSNDYDLLARKIFHLDHTDFSQKQTSNTKNYLPYAASLVILLALGSLLFYFSDNSVPSVFVPSEFGLDNLLNDTSVSSQWTSFATSFQSRDYSSALQIIDSMPESAAGDSVLYFKGVTAFKFGDFKLAAESFVMLNDYGQSIFLQDGEYFLALSLLYQKNMLEAEFVLNSIINQNSHPFQAESMRLLEQFY